MQFYPVVKVVGNDIYYYIHHLDTPQAIFHVRSYATSMNQRDVSQLISIMMTQFAVLGNSPIT
jgi:hypothetical protein